MRASRLPHSERGLPAPRSLRLPIPPAGLEARAPILLRSHPASTRSTGLSLIELLVAIVILSVGVVGVLRAFALATRYNYSAENQTAAGLLAHDMLEEIRADGALSEGLESGTFDGDQSRFAWTRSVRKAEKDRLYEVHVTVSWPESTRQRDLTLTTLIYVN